MHEKMSGHMSAQDCQKFILAFSTNDHILYIEICTVALYCSSDICQIQLPQKCLECQVPDYYPCSDIVTCGHTGFVTCCILCLYNTMMKL